MYFRIWLQMALVRLDPQNLVTISYLHDLFLKGTKGFIDFTATLKSAYILKQ